MRPSLVASSLIIVAACGGGASLGPKDPFPDVAGSYQIDGGFDGLTRSEASFGGSLTLTQASRQSGTLGGTMTFTLTINGDVSTASDVPIQSASVTPAGVVSFRLGSTAAGGTWTFTGTQVGKTISGRHTLTDGTNTFSGDWTTNGTGPTTGSLTVTSSTSGPSPDPDGYSVSVDGTDRGTLGVTAAGTVTGLTSGSHTVGLGGVAANCQVQGENPRAAVVTAGGVTTVSFLITCVAPPQSVGTLRITTATTGSDQDPDGFTYIFDSGSSQPIGINDVATLANVAAGTHSVQLSGIASNCAVQGANPASATVSAGSTAELAFSVRCTSIIGPATTIAAVSGDNQSGQVGSTLSQPLVVQVTDASGHPVPGVTVAWGVTGGGSVSAASTVTGADGTTSVTRTLGTTAGTQTTTASVQGLVGSPVTFTSTATAGNGSRVDKVAGDGQSGLAGAELPNPLVVQVLDAQGNAVVGRAVTWVIGAGGGSVAPQNTTTDAQGKASTRWTLGPSVGNNTVNAVVSGVGTATFTATGTAGSVSPSKSTVQLSQGSITAGASTNTITVRVKDANGTAISGVAVSVTSSGSGNQIDPALATSDENGVATFTFGSTVAETKTITAVAGGVTLDQKPTISVLKASSITRITGHAPNPSTSGQVVHVTFSVTSNQGGGTPTGQVTISSAQEPGASCTAAVAQGSCDITLTVVGVHTLIASYSGDTRFQDSNDTDTHTVAPAPNPPPVAAFTHDNCVAGSDCQFHDASTDNVAVVGWSWDFGDLASPNNSSTLQNPLHSFTLGGGTTYTVTLTVTDNQGATNSTSQQVVVP